MTNIFSIRNKKTRDLCHGKSEEFSGHMAQVQICDCAKCKGEVLLKKIAFWNVCTQPSSILKHPSVAVTNLLGSHYGQLTTSGTFSLWLTWLNELMTNWRLFFTVVPILRAFISFVGPHIPCALMLIVLGNRATELSSNSLGHFVRSWSLMIFHRLFCIQNHNITKTYNVTLSTCGAFLEVVFEFD